MRASVRIGRFLCDYPDGDLLIVVGCASPAGVAWLASCTRNRRVSLLIGDTRPRFWRKASNRDRALCLEFMERSDVEVRDWYRTAKAAAGESSARLKVWAVTEGGSPVAVLVGSGNLTVQGLDDNTETLVEAQDVDKTGTHNTVRELWNDAGDAKERLTAYLHGERHPKPPGASTPSPPEPSHDQRPATNQQPTPKHRGWLFLKSRLKRLDTKTRGKRARR